MWEDKYRTIERSKPAQPPPPPERRLEGMWKQLDFGFVRTRRNRVLGFAAFFLVGTLVGVLFGPSSRPTAPPPAATPPSAASSRSMNASQSAEQGPVRLRAYAYTSPPVAGEEQRSGALPSPDVTPSTIERRSHVRPEGPPATAVDRMPDEPAAKIGTRLDRSQGEGLPRWLAHAVPEPPEAAEPRIAIVIDDLGVDQARTRRAVALPGPLTMAFLPYGYNLRALSGAARAAGHELIVHLPMQPQDADADPGPNALLQSLAPAELRERIGWNLSRFEGFVGVSNHMGSGFTRWEPGIDVLMQEMKGRGLLFFDSLTSRASVAGRIADLLDVPFAVRDVFLDNEPSVIEIRKQLEKLEDIARKRGYAIGIGHPYDPTIETLRAWLDGAKARGISIVPLSAIVKRRRAAG